MSISESFIITASVGESCFEMFGNMTDLNNVTVTNYRGLAFQTTTAGQIYENDLMYHFSNNRGMINRLTTRVL